MNSHDTKTAAVRIARAGWEAGDTDDAILEAVQRYFAIETDRVAEWAAEFARDWLRQAGAELARRMVDHTGGQAAAAAALGVTPASVSRFLSGEREPSRPVRLLALLLLA